MLLVERAGTEVRRSQDDAPVATSATQFLSGVGLSTTSAAAICPGHGSESSGTTPQTPVVVQVIFGACGQQSHRRSFGFRKSHPPVPG